MHPNLQSCIHFAFSHTVNTLHAAFTQIHSSAGRLFSDWSTKLLSKLSRSFTPLNYRLAYFVPSPLRRSRKHTSKAKPLASEYDKHSRLVVQINEEHYFWEALKASNRRKCEALKTSQTKFFYRRQPTFFELLPSSTTEPHH